jgi:hypothetical protein
MSTIDFEITWRNQNVTDAEQASLSLEEIKETTLNFSSENISSGRRLVIFDSLYKSVVLTGYLFLLLMGTLTSAKVIFTVSVAFCFIFIMFRNRTLYKQLLSIDETGPVIPVFKKRYDALQVFYPEFFFNSSLTSPLFVFAGFQFYHLLRYREDGFFQLLSDPVTYVFLILAFIIPYIAQRMNYSEVQEEMESILDLDFRELEDKLEVIRIRTKRRRRRIIFMILALLGSALLLTLLISTL